MRRPGFTLIELLVVLLIILLISAVALPTVVGALRGRETGEAARLLQGALVGARDRAIHDRTMAGIRLVPDPTIAGTYHRIIPIGPAPDYAEGAVTVRKGFAYSAGVAPVPALVLEEALVDRHGLPNAPTSWSWNVRVGDRLQINGAGPWYTVCGPMFIGPASGGNPEGFINWGNPGTPPPLAHAGKRVEWLLLTDGRDDNDNGWTDEGFDGVDNDAPGQPGTGLVDDPGEWEAEAWQGAASAGLVSESYAIRRRPMPVKGAPVLLPTGVVVDLARSALTADPLTGFVDILIGPDGSAAPSIPYAVPTAIGPASAWMHFALVARKDAGSAPAPPAAPWSVLSLSRTGQVVTVEDPDPAAPFAWAMRGGR